MVVVPDAVLEAPAQRAASERMRLWRGRMQQNGHLYVAWDLSPVWVAFAETGARFVTLDEAEGLMLMRHAFREFFPTR